MILQNSKIHDVDIRQMLLSPGKSVLQRAIARTMNATYERLTAWQSATLWIVGTPNVIYVGIRERLTKIG